VKAFFAQGEPGRTDAENVLKEYSSRTDKLKVEFIDPTIDILTARRYNLTRSGVVVFDNGARREQATANTESEFTAALIRLRETGTKTIAILDIPSMVDFTGTGTQQQVPMSLVQAELINQNYSFLPPYSLTISPTISVSDVTVLIVPPPPQTQPLTETAVRAISDYLDRGGHVLLMTDPEAAPLPVPLLQKYGLTEYHDVIVENDRQNVWALPGTAPQAFNMVVSTYPFSAITKDMTGLRTFYSVVAAIQPPAVPITGFVSTSVVQSGANSVRAKIVQSAEGVQLQPDESDPRGPLTMIVSVEPQEPATPITDTAQPTQTHRMRLVVTGDADFGRDDFIQSFQFTYNRDLFTNIVNWLAESEDRISIPARDTTQQQLTLDAAQSSAVFYTSVLFLPVLVLLLGGFIWWRRR
jgi:hypothetical protein